MVRLAVISSVIAMAGVVHAGDIVRPMGMYVADPSQPPLVMIDSAQTITVRGPIVETVVTQRFRNQTDRVTEATYIFPLPGDAAVSAMSIRHGTRTIRAAIEKRADAQRRYEAAVRAGLIAGLVEQERNDVFTQTVSAIPARGVVEVTLRYDALAQLHGDRWRLVIPLVVAPRMVPGIATGVPTAGTGRAADTDRAPDASRITPNTSSTAGGKTAVSIHFVDPLLEVTSATHQLTGKQDVSFVDPRTDHDAIIEWRTSVTAAGWSEPASDGGFAAVMVTAPPAPARGGAMRLVLVLDRSATIRGDADAIQRPLVRALLANLSAADRVSIVGSEQVAWARPADALTAIESIWQRTSSRFDLTSVLARLRAERAAVVMITDGLVADDRAAIATAKQLGIPIHVIGVGPAPARGLLTQLAAATRGTIRFAGVGDDLSAIASASVLDAASPATAMTVTWGTLAVSDVVPGVLPRLGGGQSMLVLARIERAELANGRAHGELFAIVPGEPPRPVDGMTTAVGPLGRRWARARLEELIADGDRSAITAHALRFGLVSPETALVAIGSDVVVRNGVKHTVAVPVAVPAGIHATALERSKLEKSSAQIDAAPPGTAGSPKPLAGAAREDDSNDDAKSFAETEATAPSSTSAGRAAAPVALESRPLPRLPRLSGGFGGGIAITNSASDLVLGGSLRYEIAVNRRLALGAETSVWFGGRDAQGQVLATASILELATRWELAPGLGVRFGDGTGPAASIGVRFRVPALPQAAGFLRYDAALVRRPASDGWIFQHAPLVGIEWSLL